MLSMFSLSDVDELRLFVSHREEANSQVKEMLNFMSCSNCKNWGNAGIIPNDPEIRHCTKVKQYADCYEPDNDYSTFKLKEDSSDIKAFSFDSELYSSALYTRADFFCNMYEPE